MIVSDRGHIVDITHVSIYEINTMAAVFRLEIFPWVIFFLFTSTQFSKEVLS